jgi:hypothetical protein
MDPNIIKPTDANTPAETIPVTTGPAPNPSVPQPPSAVPPTPPADPVPAPPAAPAPEHTFSPALPPNAEPFPKVVVGNMGAEQASQPAFNPVMPEATGSKPKGKLIQSSKTLLIALAGVLLLGGASAAAYYGVVVPNKPENVIKNAVINSLQQQQYSFNGAAETSGETVGAKVDIKGQADSAKKALDTSLKITVAGVSINADVKIVDKSLYIKLSDLNQLSDLVAAFSPQSAGDFQKASTILGDKWIAIDSTLLGKSGACVFDTNWTLNGKDVDLLSKQYAKHPFALVKSSASDTVAGKQATKYVVEIDNKTADQYTNDLKELSMVKALSSCPGLDSVDQQVASAKGKTNLTIWVDKSSKLVSQIGYSGTDSGASSNLKLAFDYGPVTISKPQNSTSVAQVFTELSRQFGNKDAYDELFKALPQLSGQQPSTSVE